MPDVTPTLTLPTRFYAVEDEQVWIDLEALGQWPLGFAAYDVDVTCSYSSTYIGTQSDRAWYATPVTANVGDRTWTISIYHQGTQVATESTTLRIKAALASGSPSRKVLVIGDSTTANNLRSLAELQDLGGVGDLTVTTVGSLSSSNVPSFDASLYTCNHEGVGGKTYSYFYTDNASPFVYTGVFDFGQYLTDQSITLSADDWVFFALGINDIFSATSDATVATTWATLNTQLDAMIAAMQSEVTGLRIAVGLPLPPASSQHAFGDDYTSNQYRARYKRNRDLLIAYLQAEYGGSEGSDVYILPLYACLDTENNFPLGSTAVNAYNTATVDRHTNALHPANAGYFQMGALYYAFMRGHES